MPRVDGPIRIWIKPKVLAGFAIVIAFAITSISITYNSFIELSRTKQSLSHPNKKLLMLNSALADIYEAESNIRAYNLTRNENYLKIYFSFLININDKVDSLLYLTKDSPSQNVKIKTIKQLLGRKEKVLDEFIDFKLQDHSLSFYEKAMNEIAKVQAFSNTQKPLFTTTTTTTTSKKDTVVKKTPQQKPGFFGRIKGWISGSEKNDTTVTKIHVETRTDTLIRLGYIPDTVVGSVVDILTQIRNEQDAVRERASSKELELLQSDKDLMDQIRVIISMLEREELSQSYKRSNNAEDVVNKSTIIVLALGGAALIMLLLFLAIIFRDITKGTYYRNELYEAKKYAEKLLKVKEQFLANMSHEIRTPLSSIIGLTRQIKKSELNARQEEYVKLLSSSSEHLLSVINDILDFSKIDAGQLKIENLPFNLHEVIDESINTLRGKANEKSISLEFKDDNPLNKTLWGDPFRLKQIVLNLLSNAIKFTEKGSVTITIAHSEIDKNFIRIQIKVTDTGIGIPAEQQSIIFDEFTQADPSTTRRYGGSGLGLTIVKKLTELQGGEVNLESRVGVGTTFSVTIPYKLSGQQVENTNELNKPLAVPNGVKALIIDDDEVNRLISEELLKNIGIAADTTGNPLDINDLIAKNKYQLILTDIHMPGLSGYDIVDFIKKQGYEIPVIAVTANSMINNPNHFTEKGFSGYLIKPYTEKELIKTIEPFIRITQSSIQNIRIEENKNEEYDLSDIYRFSGGDMASARLILSTFLDNTDRNMVELSNHIKSKDIKSASAVAHKMKPAFRQFKIYNIAGLLLKIEKLEDNKESIREAKELNDELNAQIKSILKSLRKELERMSN